MGFSYCCMTMTGSLCNACLGSTAAGTTGRKRSVLLLTVAVILALYFQYVVGPNIVSQKGWVYDFYRYIPGAGPMVYHAWYDSCAQYATKDMTKAAATAIVQQCAGNAGVFRPMAIATNFFTVNAIVSKYQPHFNRSLWPTKYGIFFVAVFISVFWSNRPMFTGVYLWIARFGATIFVLLQQVILVDVAYNWNEDWVDRADQYDRLVYGSGNTWLRAIVTTCAGFYLTTLIGIIMLYRYFDGCAENVWIITLTLLGIIALTVLQLSGSEGSLLTSSIISLYVTYLAYSMVSKNPNGHCNPQLGNNDVTGIVIGLTLTAISLAWTGWSWTAEERLNVDGVQSAKTMNGTTSQRLTSSNGGVNLDVPFLDPGDAPTSGLVMGDDNDDNDDSVQFRAAGSPGSQVWKLNVVMALISCFVAMTLTGWGTLERIENDDPNYHAANPTIGRFNMAMIGISQWCAILLYVWTLAAPVLFPDRDFS
jgi:serine incorporator 1/3